jgi:general secretion pathway protein G
MNLWIRVVETLKKRLRTPSRVEVGMTLIEIMVVVAIIGLLMGTVGVVAYRRYQKAKLTNAKQIIANVQQALGHYRLETNESCPSDVKELYTKKFLTKEPKDPWGEQLIFKCPGENDTEGADISSKGPDKQEGTDDDITSWETEGEEE